MTTHAERRSAIEAVLWPPGSRGSVWAVLDLARDKRIHAALLESRLEFLCLYAGKLPRELELVAPHVVELLPGHRLLDRLFGEGWGQSWGVFVHIDDPTALRRHLRRFLKVRDESGRRLLFRYYDPRVLRAFLPTCTADELSQFFGPVDRFYAESADGSGLVRYSLRRGALHVEPLAVLTAES
jgi:hypothetical protein